MQLSKQQHCIWNIGWRISKLRRKGKDEAENWMGPHWRFFQFEWLETGSSLIYQAHIWEQFFKLNFTPKTFALHVHFITFFCLFALYKISFSLFYKLSRRSPPLAHLIFLNSVSKCWFVLNEIKVKIDDKKWFVY